jgi:putative membrane protein
MFVLFLLAVLGTLFFLARSGRLGTPPWGPSRQSPEFEARKVLAERFARGDISSDEFLERASILNWTPGSDAYPESRRRKR